MHELAKPSKNFYPQIQALRAIGVIVLILFHYWPDSARGGYAALDLFFVISGFLITGIILKGVEQKGKVTFGNFWLRRTLRILPAALLVLFVSLIATLVIANQALWGQFLSQIQASALYLENWYLAINSVNYFGSELNASPVQHYWSLSVEEQFYLIWPLVIAATLIAAKKQKQLLLIITLIITLAGLACSVIITAKSPAVAYFITPTRMWEITAGALLALIGLGQGQSQLRALASWIGLAILISFFIGYNNPERFPGSVALIPVLATIMVIWGGASKAKWSPNKLINLRPVQWLGDSSYSIYLWHWPLLIFATVAIGEIPNNQIKVALVIATIIIATISKKLVEDPLRYSKKLQRQRPVMIIGSFALIIILLVALAALVPKLIANDQKQVAQFNRTTLNKYPQCRGAASGPLNQNWQKRCRQLETIVSPTPAEISSRLGEQSQLIGISLNRFVSDWEQRDCQATERSAGLDQICLLGDPKGRRQVALIGDSHSIHWRPALNGWGKQSQTKVISIARLGCPFSLTKQTNSVFGRQQCFRWRQATIDWLSDHPEIKTIIVTNKSKPGLNRSLLKQAVNDYRDLWRQLPASVKQIIVIRDNPIADPARAQQTMIGQRYNSLLDCLSKTLDRRGNLAQSCAQRRDQVLLADPAVIAANQLTGRRVEVVDLSDYFCDRKSCYPVVGGVMVFEDSSHITAEFSRTLGGPLGQQLNQLLKR